MWSDSSISQNWKFAQPQRLEADVLAVPPKIWTWLTAALVIGYLTMGKSFAYLGIEPIKVFIGEVALGAFLILRPRECFGRWMSGLTTYEPLSLVFWSFYLFLGYGILQALRGMLLGHPPLTAVQNVAFNYYPLYIFLGLYAGRNNPAYLPKVIRLLAWGIGLYGIPANIYLATLPIYFPFTEIPIFGLPTGAGIALLGLMCFETNLKNNWFLFLLTAFVLLLRMIRAEWVATVAGFLVLGLLTRQFGRLLGGFAAVAMVLIVVMVSDIDLPGNRFNFNSQSITTLVIGMAGTSVLEKYVDDDRSLAVGGTVEWRKKWWQGIWDGLHQSDENALIGFGYGFALNSLGAHLGGEGEVTRTPHNIFYYVLGYTGWIGVALFWLFQFAVAQALYQTFKRTGQPFGLVIFSLVLTMSHFGNLLETPFGAVPFYLLIGLSLAQSDSPNDRKLISSKS